MASRRRSPAPALLAFATLTALAGCERGHPAPTPTATIDDTFVIVTATAGAPDGQTPNPTDSRVYVIEEGNTLSSIATRFGVSEQALIEANHLADPDSIQVGQILLIPEPKDRSE